MNQKNKNIISAVVILAIIAIIAVIEVKKPAAVPAIAINVMSKTDKAKMYPAAKELIPGGQFFNTENGQPIKLADYVGKKVVLIDFWTYSCINCQRTLPYLKEWYKKYKDDGFVIVGVHSPEFDFEKDPNNVKKAIADAGITYPVMQDNNMATWQAYGNEYWPREYLIDIDGYIVHDHIGEGDYDKTEAAIQAALEERTKVIGDNLKIDTSISVPSADDIEANSPETYFGSARNEYLGNGSQGRQGMQNFTLPDVEKVSTNELYLGGQWNMLPEYAESAGAGMIEYQYSAKGAYLVAGGPKEGMELEVTSDGKPIDQSIKGADIYYRDGKSYVKISDQRLYRIIDASSAQTHTLQFTVPSAGLQAFTFTFG
jgi:thiol-disulfide isomerase/thioredoxin